VRGSLNEVNRSENENLGSLELIDVISLSVERERRKNFLINWRNENRKSRWRARSFSFWQTFSKLDAITRSAFQSTKCTEAPARLELDAAARF
jgi:hypothetical protein